MENPGRFGTGRDSTQISLDLSRRLLFRSVLPTGRLERLSKLFSYQPAELIILQLQPLNTVPVFSSFGKQAVLLLSFLDRCFLWETTFMQR